MKAPQPHTHPDQASATTAAASHSSHAPGPSPATMALAHSPRMTAQRHAIREAFGPAAAPAQLQGDAEQQLLGEVPATAAAAQRAEAGEDVPNLTGMPSRLKSGIEALSGMDMSDVRVHRNSDKPAQLNALAYAQGNDIHLGPGQDRHLGHEAWHVVQQRQGRVTTTMQMAGFGVNDEAELEREADLMGGKAEAGPVQSPENGKTQGPALASRQIHLDGGPVQMKPVEVAGGVFTDIIYAADNELEVGQKKTGAKMKLEFEPRADLKAERVSLVQTVKRNVKVGGKTLEQATSLMALRGNVEQEPVIDAELTAEVEAFRKVPELDQALGRLEQLNKAPAFIAEIVEPLSKAREIAQSGSYAAPETRKTKGSILRAKLDKISAQIPASGPMRTELNAALEALKQVVVKSHSLVNLDPRYTEKRMRPTDPFVEKPGEANRPEHIGHSATKREGKWLAAQLRDWPGPTADAATPVTGGMLFEVAAMAEGSGPANGAFIGSVRWGFQVDHPNTARLEPGQLELCNAGTASPAFFAAADRWNRMKLPSSQTPMQLPTHQAPSRVAPSGHSPGPAKASALPAPPEMAKKGAPSADRKPPTVDAAAIDARWDKIFTAIPVSKAKEIKMADNYMIWADRKHEPAIAQWAIQYLDWLTASLVADAGKLDARWKQISSVLDDLVYTKTFVALSQEVKVRYKTWSTLYEAAKQGKLAASEVLFDAPKSYLDEIEAKWKGNPAAAWREGIISLRAREGSWWK